MTQPAMLSTSSSYDNKLKPWCLAPGILVKMKSWESRSQTPTQSQIGLQTVWKGTDVIWTMTQTPPVPLSPPLARADLLQKWAFHRIVSVVAQKAWNIQVQIHFPAPSTSIFKTESSAGPRVKNTCSPGSVVWSKRRGTSSGAAAPWYQTSGCWLPGTAPLGRTTGKCRS